MRIHVKLYTVIFWELFFYFCYSMQDTLPNNQGSRGQKLNKNQPRKRAFEGILYILRIWLSLLNTSESSEEVNTTSSRYNCSIKLAMDSQELPNLPLIWALVNLNRYQIIWGSKKYYLLNIKIILSSWNSYLCVLLFKTKFVLLLRCW